ncbi:MAG: hypothetical protein AAB634_01075 [Patescibacteria group bacterium]
MDIEKTLKLLADQNRLSHAYLFFGPSGAPKKEIALALARELEGVSPPQDLLLYEEKTIGIDEVRELQNFLFQTPIRSKKRTCIIDGAERLTWQASPALLHLVEEPPANSLILITAREKEVLSKALLSRLVKIYIPPQKRDSQISNTTWKEGPSLAEELEQRMLSLYEKDKIRNARKISFLLRKLEMSRLNLNPKLQKKAIQHILDSGF